MKTLFRSIFNFIILPVVTFVLLSSFASCRGPENPDIRKINKQNLSEQGFYMGTLPNGKNLFRYEISMGDGNKPHYIYYISEDQPVSIDYSVSSGKSSYNQATIIIDGVEYIPKNK